MNFSRRHVLRTGAATAALAVLPRSLRAAHQTQPHQQPSSPVPIDDSRLKVMAQRCLDALQSSGASYGDVRFIRTRNRGVVGNVETETLSLGVRALTNGYWGFAAGPLWNDAEVVRLAKEAVHLARVGATGGAYSVELVPTPPISDGSWIMPVEFDPFTVNMDEIKDLVSGLVFFVRRFPATLLPKRQLTFEAQDRIFAATSGSYYAQRLYRSSGNFEIKMERNGRRAQLVDGLTPVGKGYELFRRPQIRDDIRAAVEELLEDASLPVRPIDVGRYDVVMDAMSIGLLLSKTIGTATELDRVMGYEANAGGTSYITSPLEALGTLQLGSPLLQVSANRSEPGGVASVRWDDEGVVPEDFAVVKNGILVDMQTTRESAGWIKSYYENNRLPVRSHGTAYAQDALDAPLPFSANLRMQAGTESETFDSLIAGVKKGIAFKRMVVDTDFQQTGGLAIGKAYEIRDGKRVAILAGAGILFRSVELWRNIIALGGAGSSYRLGVKFEKGEPSQDGYHSVTAVPALLKDLTVIDYLRKA